MKALKVVVLGDTAVGKSALVARMCNQPFMFMYQETIGLDLKFLRRDSTQLQIWDFAGNVAYPELVNQHLHGATIALLCVDLSQPIDLTRLNAYLSRLQRYSQNAKCILVGTKEDLATEENKKAFSDMEIAPYCVEQRMLTSSKEYTQIDDLKQALFDLADKLSLQKRPAQDKTGDEEENDAQEQRPYSGAKRGELPEISAGFFFKVAQHPATGIIGGLLMFAGLLALGVGIACLCPPSALLLAGIGIALSNAAATSAVIVGGGATLAGTIATFFYKQATDDNVAGVAASLESVA